MRLGLGVGANDAEAVLRGLPSIALRYRAHDETARALAVWCQKQPQFVQVLHPALTGSPGHENWRAVCVNALGGAAGLFSVVIDPRFNQDTVDAFCEALVFFRIGWSWAGPVSLVVPYKLASIRTSWPKHIAQGTVVRFAIGLEAFEDLQADLEQALKVLV
jgi:cystathionine beta-lyase